MTDLIATSANAVVSILTLTPIHCIDRRALRAGKRQVAAKGQTRQPAAALHPVADPTDHVAAQESGGK